MGLAEVELGGGLSYFTGPFADLASSYHLFLSCVRYNCGSNTQSSLPQLSLQDLLVCNKGSLLHPLHLSPCLPKWTVLPSLQLHVTSHAGTVYIGVHDMHGRMHPNLRIVIDSHNLMPHPHCQALPHVHCMLEREIIATV